MRIWVIGRGYPEKGNNMLGSFELEQAKMLSRAGQDVSYPVVDIRSVRRRRKFGFYTREEDGVRIAVVSFPVGPILPRSLRNRLSRALMKRLMKKLAKKSGNPEIIHVHYPSLTEYRSVESWQRAGTKIAATEHWTSVQNKTLGEPQLRNLKDFVSKADAMCCVGPSLRTAIRELTATEKEITIVPNVVNELFRPTGETHEGFRFLCSGRLVAVKQFDMIVNSFLDVFGGRKDVSLTLAGNGEEAETIRSILSSRNARDQVRLTGEVSREEMAGLVAGCDAMVVFSRLETFCVPVIEAWACGKPVIATDVTVFAENPDERLGIMADWRDTESLKAALAEMEERRAAYDPEWIRQYAAEHFSEDAVSRQLIAIYQKALEKA